MTKEITREEFALFQTFIEQQCGIHLGSDKAYLVEHRLSRLLGPTGSNSYGDLLRQTKREPVNGRLCSLIVDAITTKETSWFRDAKQFEALGRVILPELWNRVRDGRRAGIRIWSAACSTGQEPYTIAMTAAEFCRTVFREPDCPNLIRITATDISPTALETARRGGYDDPSIKRGLDPDQVQRFFRREGAEWVVKDELKGMIDFRRINLKDSFSGLGGFDVIFLRNVIIYFAEELKRDVLDRAAAILNPGGRLFLGTGETVSGYSRAFEVEEILNVTVFRKKEK